MSKLNKLKEINGKLDGSLPKPTTLDQVFFGDDGFSKYKTMDEGEYEEQLASFNRTDLHNHAIKMGLIPHADREVMKNRLMREFRKHVSGYVREEYNNIDTAPKKLTKEMENFLKGH